MLSCLLYAQKCSLLEAAGGKVAEAGCLWRARRHRGVTLLELLLVLVLLVVLAGLSYPALERALASHSLSAAASELQAAVAKARLRAMETGVVHVLSLMPGDNHFQILAVPDNGLTTELWGMSTAGFGTTTNVVAYSQTLVPDSELSGQLPEGIRVLDALIEPDLRTLYYQALVSCGVTSDQPIEGTAGEVLPAGTIAGESIALVFFPDGTCCGGVVRLADGSGNCVEVEIRALTGVATIGNRYTLSEQELL